MSEASNSLQVRTDDPEACIASLQESGMQGFVFRGDQGWLTVVPYDKQAGFVFLDDMEEAMAAFLGVPVINYACHEDFGWAFSLALPDGRATTFQCWSANPLEDGGLNKAVLSEVVPIDRVQPFLDPLLTESTEEIAAYGFARAMGFPQFAWLSPAYVLDKDDARERGGEEIGSNRVVSSRSAPV